MNNPTEEDKKFIQKCIEISEESKKRGDAPFGSLIVKNGIIISESINNAQSRVSDHAEIIALHKAHQNLGTQNLSECTLYTNCEPCPMCSFMIREYKIKKVVFGVFSPDMGGYSRWDILQDQGLSQYKIYFSEPPTVIGGVLESDAKKTFDNTQLDNFGTNS